MEWKRGSGRIERWRAFLLDTIFGTGVLTAVDGLSIESATDDVVTDTRNLLHPATADEHDGVFLEVVAFAGDVSRNFHLVGKAHTGNLTKSGVRLLRGAGVDAGADTTLLRAGLQGHGCGLVADLFTSVADELLNSRHF